MNKVIANKALAGTEPIIFLHSIFFMNSFLKFFKFFLSEAFNQLFVHIYLNFLTIDKYAHVGKKECY